MATCKEGMEVSDVSQIKLDDFCRGVGKGGGACNRYCQEKFRQEHRKVVMSVPQIIGAVEAAKLGLDELEEYFKTSR